jgi:predicted ATP-dependent Lon-type protease
MRRHVIRRKACRLSRVNLDGSGAFDAGAKRILLPMSSVTDIPSVPGELFAKSQTSFYADPVDAEFKALGVE